MDEPVDDVHFEAVEDTETTTDIEEKSLDKYIESGDIIYTEETQNTGESKDTGKPVHAEASHTPGSNDADESQNDIKEPESNDSDDSSSATNEKEKIEEAGTDEKIYIEAPKKSTISDVHIDYGTAVAAIAEDAYTHYNGTNCYKVFMHGNTDYKWSDDFIVWCAQNAGQEYIFGNSSKNAASLTNKLINGNANIIYPGGEISRPGDIVVWWNSNEPGTSDTLWEYSDILSLGIVVEASADSITVIQGDLGSLDYELSTVKRFSIDPNYPVSRDVSVLLMLRPNYQDVVTSCQNGEIQSSLSFALYNNTSAIMSCDFDGYTSIYGRHEGIDFSCAYGSPVYSLTDGQVIRIATGTDAGELSSICIYDAEYDRTVIYLHTAPSSTIAVGQMVTQGTLIATEAARGATAAHTHVEVVNGIAYYANVSVGDDIIDNEDPYPYWAQIVSSYRISEILCNLVYIQQTNSEPYHQYPISEDLNADTNDVYLKTSLCKNPDSYSPLLWGQK